MFSNDVLEDEKIFGPSEIRLEPVRMERNKTVWIILFDGIV